MAVAPPTSRQTFLARHSIKRTATMEDASQIEEHELDGRRGRRGSLAQGRQTAGQITVEHETDEKVKLWKRGPYGWVPRPVPSHAVRTNLANGWMEYCPDCGTTECELDPNTCTAKRGRRSIVCPVIQANGTPCGKTIFATGIARAGDRVPGEFEVTGAYGAVTPELELKGKMDLHLMTYHRDEARILGLFEPRQTMPAGVDLPNPEEIER